MPNIPCKEPECTQLITDPCIKLRGLFALRKDLSDRLQNTGEVEQQKLLSSIDQLFERELGLNPKRTREFVEARKTVKTSDPILFTLKCIKGHIHQYSITCRS